VKRIRKKGGLQKEHVVVNEKKGRNVLTLTPPAPVFRYNYFVLDKNFFHSVIFFL